MSGDLPENENSITSDTIPPKIKEVVAGPEVCPTCEKIKALCFCELIEPIDNRVHVLILRHPQELDKELGSAKLTTLALKNSTLKTALSVASLKAALGQEANAAEWAVLFLGSQKNFKSQLLPNEKAHLTFFNKKDEVVQEDKNKIKGLIVLDGSWAQAKTLWWRNAWLLKCKRIVIETRTPSLYGKMRKEPRKECLSTIEAVAYSLDLLGEKEEIGHTLISHFRRQLQKYRDYKSTKK